MATGHTPDAACGVVETETPGDISGTVPGTLALTIGAPASFGTFLPGIEKTYDASMTANVVSTATAASLTVRDPSFTATGHLVNGSYALEQPLRARASNVDVSGVPFAALNSDRSPLALLTYIAPVSNDAVTLDFRQSIGASEALYTGAYGKTLVFTLTTSTP